MSSGRRHLARKGAVQALYQWDLTGQEPDQIEAHFIAEHDFEGFDIEYFRRLIGGVPLFHQEIDSRLEPHLDRSLDAVDPVERAVLRLAVFELEYEKDVPYRVVLNEAIDLAKIFGAEHGYRYVNGVLDKLVSELRGAEVNASS